MQSCRIPTAQRRACSTRASKPFGGIASATLRASSRLPVSASPASRSSLASIGISQLQGSERRLAPCRVGRREGVFLFGFGGNDEDDYEEEYTVCKLQIGVFGDINKWQAKLDSIATKYETDDPEGLHAVYTDALVHVLRNMEYVGYVSSAGKVFNSIEETEQKFNSVLMEERLKFKEETLVNVDGRQKKRTMDADMKGADTGLDRWLCLTFLMAVEGKVKIPKVDSGYELKQVLTMLGGLSADDLVAFELLWTPQETNDSYSKTELLADYPSMVTLV